MRTRCLSLVGKTGEDERGPLVDGEEGGLRKVAADCGYKLPLLALRLGISTRQLSREFKARLQSSPGAWLRAARLQEARCLLRTAASVKHVAYSMGYRHESQFCRDFRAHFGYSPSADLDTPRVRRSGLLRAVSFSVCASVESVAASPQTA